MKVIFIFDTYDVFACRISSRMKFSWFMLPTPQHHDGEKGSHRPHGPANTCSDRTDTIGAGRSNSELSHVEMQPS
jgi:hypothetical protein